MRADSFLFGQVKDLLTNTKVAVIAASGSRLTGLPPASPLWATGGGVFQIIGAVTAGLLLGAASVTLGSQLADLAAELLVFLLQRRDSPDRIGRSAPPIAGLLTPLEILTAQVGHLGAQRIDFRQEPRDQAG